MEERVLGRWKNELDDKSYGAWPAWHEHTGLSRKYDAQTSLLPEGKTRKHGQGPSIAEGLSKRMSRLDRRRERNQAKRLALARKLRPESSSGGSSSSSDSSSD